MNRASDLITEGSANLTQNESSWYEGLAAAWGVALDKQASKIVEMSLDIGEGLDSPAKFNALTAESLRMGFISQSSHTSLTSVATALETLARKQ